MDLSSLVFVAIIGVWAAYLVPHWLSRRDDLSQSRTTDRFSGGLRVLQRRPRKPRTGADHRSGDAVLTSPRVVLDADGEYLYIPADRALAARAERRAAETAAAGSVETTDAEPVVSKPAGAPLLGSAVESSGARSATGWPGPNVGESVGAGRVGVERAGAEPGYAETDVTRIVDPVGVAPADAERVSVERVDAVRAEVEPVRAEPAEAPRADAEQPVDGRPDAEQVDAEQVDAEQVDAARADAERGGIESVGVSSAVEERLERSRTTDRLLPDSTEVPDSTEAADSPLGVPDGTSVEIPASDPSSDPPWSAFAPGGPSSLEALASVPSVPAVRTPEAEIPERPFDLEVAIGIARIAARRRARIMALLFIATVVSWVVTSVSSMSAWVAVPATVLLVMHVLASRVAGLRSREALMLLAVQVQSAALQARPQRSFAAPSRPAEVVAEAAPVGSSERAARRAAAVGAETWEPVPVPPPTYTLKPAVHRPEPAPLDVPAAASADAPGTAVSRGALPRRAADIERILALESDLDDLFEEPKVVNG
ncbi:MAG TPA: hypothetical protein VLL08_08130 [Kineosporiaceae bacterium]|nr:hypothetical protein [Kineosporiaceae bacterium]